MKHIEFDYEDLPEFVKAEVNWAYAKATQDKGMTASLMLGMMTGLATKYPSMTIVEAFRKMRTEMFSPEMKTK